ncbi:hypothetical protein OPW39_15530 [Vibrio europaeus]|uniref:hypothetical protein n=1 Tax=Vibrio europaeus TaxID=300876 RepID=UPI00233F0C78|nr:hypothetical protein [Vibrio europaeus]MDC5870218.1 hypothetical protein [Vibrio europaeus]
MNHRNSSLQIDIMTVIYEHTKLRGHPEITMVDLKEAMKEKRECHSVSITRSCQKLAERNLIKRIIDVQSLKLSLSLTAEGEKTLAENG